MGTPEFAVPSLRAVARSCDVALVVTRPDRPRGRGRHLGTSEVAQAAEELGLPVTKPEDVNAQESCAALQALAPDLFAVVAFGAILKPALLSVPRLGSINLHGALLPEYRGAAPVHAALRDGRTGTGVSTMWIEEGIDTGDIILQRWIGIEPDDHAGSLAGRLAELGAPLLAESLLLAHADRAPRVKQDATRASYAPRIRKCEGLLDWKHDVEAVWNRQRAVTPWPGATTGFHGRRLIVTESRPLDRIPVADPPGTVVAVTTEGVAVACGTGALLLARVKPDGRAEMDAAEWARGARVERGATLEFEIEKEAHA
jgi:methionyl-tRNA formyltransferase